MIHMSWRYLILICLILLACASIVACQAPQPQCCDLTFGLLRSEDLSGRWDLANEIVRASMDSMMHITRYTDVTATQWAKQYLVRSDGPLSQSMAAIHDLRRYESSTPQLDEIPLMASKAEGSFDPDISKVGDASRAQCQSSDPAKPEMAVVLCVAEVRYNHYISVMIFSLPGSISNVDIQEIMNQALSKTDQRIQQMEQHK